MNDLSIAAVILILAGMFFAPVLLQEEKQEIVIEEEEVIPTAAAATPTRIPTPLPTKAPEPTPTCTPAPTEEAEPTICIPVMNWQPEPQDEEKLRFIEEHGLIWVRLSCYLPTGNCTADGTIPYEGICAANWEHMGQKCIMYDKDLNVVAVWECHDVGSNPLLMSGQAIDVFRNDMDRAWELIGLYGDHVYIKWVEE
ncbi:MAG: hypothetical protein IK115_07845 [Lachnospiraceae bacterium]|nr:hypothetical protein [Lachnospiraceae bacterium]